MSQLSGILSSKPWKGCLIHVANHVLLMSEVLLVLAVLRPLPMHRAVSVDRLTNAFLCVIVLSLSNSA